MMLFKKRGANSISKPYLKQGSVSDLLQVNRRIEEQVNINSGQAGMSKTFHLRRMTETFSERRMPTIFAIPYLSFQILRYGCQKTHIGSCEPKFCA